MSSDAFQARIDAARDKVDIVAAVAAAGVTLSRARDPRGKCPFHGSKSDSFVVYPEGKAGRAGGFARCFGCQWSGDVIKFTADTYGMTFVEALQRLEEENGLDGLTPMPAHREKQVRTRPGPDYVDSASMGRFIWRTGEVRPEAVRRYLMARGMPAAVLTDERLSDFRYHPLAPISAWAIGADGKVPAPPRDCQKAPAICALIRRPIRGQERAVTFAPIGLHVTWLSPSLDAKMVRKRWDGELYPARKMLGEADGCVLLGAHQDAGDGRCATIDAAAPLYPGEGIETVFSGMAIADAPAAAIGIATLSLDNLQGDWLRWRNGVTPLFDIRANPAAPALCFAHDGPVTGLIDADMAPLRGPRDRVTGEFKGVAVVERRGGPIVRRAITGAERAAICAELFVQNWRAAGCPRVTAKRPRMGLDFNDAIREVEHV